MAWVWTVLGTVVGAAVGGPWGAGIGLVIGAGLDDMADEEQPGYRPQVGYRGDAISDEDAAIISVACFMARMGFDTNHLDHRERQLIATICFDEMAFPTRYSRSELLGNLHGWALNEELFHNVLRLCQSEEGIRKMMLSYAWRLASLDNEIDDDEGNWITQAAQAMGSSDEEFYYSMLPYFRPPEDDEALRDARRTLEVDADASPEEIKLNYRRLCRQYHPDSHATADQSTRDWASAHFRRVSAAYDLLKSETTQTYFGIALERSSLFAPDSRDPVRCFFCEQKCRLPEPSNHLSARCPKCQSLLLFEEELAHALFRGVFEA